MVYIALRGHLGGPRSPQLWHRYGVHCIVGASGGSKITTAVAQVWCTLHRGGIWGVQDHHSCGTGMVYIASWGHLGGPRSPQLWHRYGVHCIVGASGGSKITTAVAQVWCTLHRRGIWGVQDHHSYGTCMVYIVSRGHLGGPRSPCTAVAQAWCTYCRN